MERISGALRSMRDDDLEPHPVRPQTSSLTIPSDHGSPATLPHEQLTVTDLYVP